MRRSISHQIDNLPLEFQRSVLRVIQEAMANIHRHARAMSVALRVSADLNSPDVEVRDAGRGVERSQLGTGKSGAGVGIPGVRARVGQFNGVLRIESSSKGTVLRVRIPIAAARSAPARRLVNARVLH